MYLMDKKWRIRFSKILLLRPQAIQLWEPEEKAVASTMQSRQIKNGKILNKLLARRLRGWQLVRIINICLTYKQMQMKFLKRKDQLQQLTTIIIGWI